MGLIETGRDVPPEEPLEAGNGSCSKIRWVGERDEAPGEG